MNWLIILVAGIAVWTLFVVGILLFFSKAKEMATTTDEKLVEIGLMGVTVRITVADLAERMRVASRWQELRTQGHAVVLDETVNDRDQIVFTMTHFKTCKACR